MANNIFEVTWKTSLITRNKGTKKQEILLLEFCKQLRGQREQTMSTMSTQHGPAVRVIRVMDSIPWVRCASGNVYKTQEVVFLIFVSPYFLYSELYFILPPEFLQFCFDHQLVCDLQIWHWLRIARDRFKLASSILLSWYHHQPESHQQSLNQRSWM